MRRVRLTITLKSEIVEKIDALIDGQKIRNRSNAIETILGEKFQERFLETAIILGGENPIKILGKSYPELLVPVQGKTLVEKNIETLRTFGIQKIILALGKLEKEVRAFLGNGKKMGVEIIYQKNKGTGEILKNLQDDLKKTFLMMNGDVLLESLDIADMYYFHKKAGGLATMSVAVSADPSQLGSIFMRGNLIFDFKNKPKESCDQSPLINAGVYILEPPVLKLAKNNNLMIENHIFPKLAKNKKLFGYQIGKDWVHLHDEKMYDQYIKTLR